MLHFPVLLEESVDFLVNKKEGSYIDCTYGRGGHTQKILETISSNSQLSSFDNDSEGLIIAYEPIWAIGTGLVPTISEITEVVTNIKERFNKPVKVLYGGSVNASNAQNLLEKTNIDGLLVGGASLNPQEFAKIAQLC